MDEKLARYRDEKNKKSQISFAGKLFQLYRPRERNIRSSTDESVENEIVDKIENSSESVEPKNVVEKTSRFEKHVKQLSKLNVALKVLLWCLLMILFVKIEFGAVYFVVSLLFILYRNTGTSQRQDGELSAYSVFNPNCEAIDGTLTADQFERELKYGPGSVR